MLVSAFVTFACVLVSTREVFAQYGIAIKKTQFPYMGFIFYSDDTIVDATGARFLHGAVLIKIDWLVSAAVDPLGPNGTGFPQKTLLARLGATSLDPKFTLNEDEEEQEREVVKVIRPFNHEASQSWLTDITLLKTLLPFKKTLAVGPVSLNFKHTYAEKSCTILAWMPGNNDMILTSLSVEMLPQCGEGIDEKTMACAIDGEETKAAMSNTDFCIGNSGGPLICEGKVMGLQTYINSNCSSPYFYQRISGWETFITCGSEDKCNDTQCSSICAVTNKDIEFKSTSESSVTVPAISSKPTSESSVIVPAMSSSTEAMTNMTIATTDDVKPTISSEAVSEIIQYENITTVPAAENNETAQIDKEIANITKTFDEEKKKEFKPVEEISTNSTPSIVINRTIMTELITSPSEPKLVFETTVNLEEHTTESKKEGVNVHEESSTFAPETNARKANMEAQLEGMQGSEPEPVPTHFVHRAKLSGSSSIWQNLCYKVAIVLTLLVIAM